MAFNTSSPIIKRPGPSAVIYDLSEPSLTTITLPKGSSWTSGLHWHETHDEFLRVIIGSIKVRIGNETITLKAGQEAKIPKLARHEWSRADDAKSDEDVVVIERTDPVDEEKHFFFWNLNGVILGEGGGSGYFNEWLLMLRLFVIFYELDNWPILFELGYVRRYGSGVAAAYLEFAITHVVLAATSKIGYALGFKAVDQRYTPPGLFQTWSKKIVVKEADVVKED
jgi:quercetin dioxygenase-like cupin family protein